MDRYQDAIAKQIAHGAIGGTALGPNSVQRSERYVEQIHRQLQETRERQHKLEKMLSIIERNPDLEELLSLMREV